MNMIWKALKHSYSTNSFDMWSILWQMALWKHQNSTLEDDGSVQALSWNLHCLLQDIINIYSCTVWTSSRRTKTSVQWRIKYCITSRRNVAIIDVLQILHDFLSSSIGSSNPESFCLLSRVAPCLDSDTKSSETPDKALVKPWSLTKPWLNGAWLKTLSLPSSVNVGPGWLLTDRWQCAAGEVLKTELRCGHIYCCLMNFCGQIPAFLIGSFAWDNREYSQNFG